jgi:hypothetical protein
MSSHDKKPGFDESSQFVQRELVSSSQVGGNCGELE